MSTATQQKPTPERFFNAVNAHQQTEAIKTAIELELFTAIAEGNNTAEALATRCQAAPRGMRILCDFLTIQGFLIGDHVARFPDVKARLAAWLAEGKITYSETILEGFDKLPEAFIGLFEGRNEGKTIVKV